jgi:hypothetical protein
VGPKFWTKLGGLLRAQKNGDALGKSMNISVITIQPYILTRSKKTFKRIYTFRAQTSGFFKLLSHNLNP